MTQYTGDERRLIREVEPPEQGWNLDKKVPLGLIGAMLAQVVCITWVFAEIKKDVELLKADSIVLHQRDSQQAADFASAVLAMRAQFDKLDSKLDRLIERGHK